MTSLSSNNTRIAKNTLMLYGRMLLGMIVSLYTSRVILAMLGETDYGINEVVGGLVGMFSIISGSLSAAVSRFLTFELGKGDKIQLKKTFETSKVIQLVLGVIVIILLESLGLWFLNHKMSIPQERMYAARWVFQASIISFTVGLLSVPFNAAIVSHEKMGVYAVIGLFEIFAKLGIVLFVAYAKHGLDRLILFACLQVTIGIIVRCIYSIYCRTHFEECKCGLSLDKKCLTKMASFAGWNFIGASAAVLRDQGGSVIINVFYGPAANAAKGISATINRAVSAFAGNFMTALNPQITKSYASGDKEYMFSIIGRGARFSFYLLWMLSLPIIMNTHEILDIWLTDVPERATLFVQLVLVFTMSEALSNPLITAMLATGNIKKYQLVVGGLQLLNLPISIFCLWLGAIPETTLIVAIILSQICLVARLSMLKTMIGIDVKWYFSDIYWNVAKVALISVPIPLILLVMLPENLLCLFFDCIICVLCCCTTAFFVGCSSRERLFIVNKAKQIVKRI